MLVAPSPQKVGLVFAGACFALLESAVRFFDGTETCSVAAADSFFSGSELVLDRVVWLERELEILELVI